MLVDIIETVRRIIESVILQFGYVGIALIMAAENIFPPIPSELVMPFAGFMAGRGQLNFVAIVLAGTLGSVVGTLVLYGIGRWMGESFVRRMVRQYGHFFLVDEGDLDRSLAVFNRYGEMAVVIGRCIPLVRSLISIPAGMSKMPILRYLLFTTVGSLPWTLALATAGLILGENWELVLDIIERYQRVVLILLALAVVAWVVWKLTRGRRQVGRDAEGPVAD